ncbi:WD repeat-containing protein 93-like isoform X4 [Mytilus californianus]|nr:WD repeat-containing protein 93-like isoform X4 [Mytilus californianus]
MPVYIRKNVNFTPPSLDKIPLEDEDDYITDPDQLKDPLPQPYRMIDKVLGQLVEDVWDIVESRENERLEESRKVRPPRHENTKSLEYLRKCGCMTDSGDGLYMFIGHSKGIIVIDANTQEKVTLWEEDRVDLQYIRAHIIAPNVYLLVSIDDMGFSRLHAFSGDKLYLLKHLNEHQMPLSTRQSSRMSLQEGTDKMIINKCKASKEGDYLGVVFENPESRDIWLEIHKLPRENWVTELDNIKAKLQKKEEPKQEMKEVKEEESTETAEPAEGTDGEKSESQSQIQQSQSNEDTAGVKFSQPSLVFKLKPPPQVSALESRGNLASSVYSTCQKVDTGEVIGTGQNHVLSTTQIELRKEVFDHLHENLLEYASKDDTVDNIQDVNFHFLNAGKMIPLGLENPANLTIPTTVAVWWKDSTHVMHYSLLKTPGKDETKPDMVWPFTAKITSSAVSDETSLMIIGLVDGNIVLWDRYLGIQRGVINISDNSCIEKLLFLDPSICPQEMTEYPPYSTRTTSYLLVQCRNGAMYAVLMGAGGTQAEPICLSPQIEESGEIFSKVETVRGLPDLILTVLQNGNVQIRDVLQGKVLCEMKVPDTHEIMSPWDPVVAIGNTGQTLYLRVIEREPAETDETTTDASTPQGTVLVYPLNTFNTLETFFNRKRDSIPLSVHTTVDKRVDALMKERIAMQALRKDRMQERWNCFKEEIWTILQYKEQAARKAEERDVYEFQRVRVFDVKS